MTRTRQLEVVREELGDCHRCPLGDTRKNIVFGIGSPNASLVFIGEGPGADEDERGEPFVGYAGALLTKMIVAMGWTRDGVYIANIIKCRPTTKDGENRQGNEDEVTQCFPFLEKQLSAIKPIVIVTLGNLATKTLLKTDVGITRMRGHWASVDIAGVPTKVMPTFHPSNLLRDPSHKKYAWSDLQVVGVELATQNVYPPNAPWVPRRRKKP